MLCLVHFFSVRSQMIFIDLFKTIGLQVGSSSLRHDIMIFKYICSTSLITACVDCYAKSTN